MTGQDTTPLPWMDVPSDDDKLWAGLAYLTQFIVPILVPAIMLISDTNRQRPFQKYHAVHALTLLAISVIYEMLAAIVYAIVGAVTGGCLYCLLWPIFILPVAAFVYYAYQAYLGRHFEVPYLTRFLKEQGWV